MDLETFDKELEKKCQLRNTTQSTRSEEQKLIKIDKDRFDIRWRDIENVLDKYEENVISILNLMAFYEWRYTEHVAVHAKYVDREKGKAKLAEGFPVIKEKFMDINRHTRVSFTWDVRNSRNQNRYQYYAVTMFLYWAVHYHKPIEISFSVESGKGLAKNLSFNNMQEVLLDSYHNGPATHWV